MTEVPQQGQQPEGQGQQVQAPTNNTQQRVTEEVRVDPRQNRRSERERSLDERLVAAVNAALNERERQQPAPLQNPTPRVESVQAVNTTAPVAQRSGDVTVAAWVLGIFILVAATVTAVTFSGRSSVDGTASQNADVQQPDAGYTAFVAACKEQETKRRALGLNVTARITVNENGTYRCHVDGWFTERGKI